VVSGARQGALVSSEANRWTGNVARWEVIRNAIKTVTETEGRGFLKDLRASVRKLLQIVSDVALVGCELRSIYLGQGAEAAFWNTGMAYRIL